MNPLHANGTSRDLRLIEGVISRLPVFRRLSPRHIAELASRSRTQSVRRGMEICSRGKPLPGVFAIAFGLAKLAVPRHKSEERVVRFVGAGETFGEAPALLGRPCPFNAVALADSMLVVIPPQPVLRLLEFDPNFAHAMVSALAGHVLDMLAELEASVQQRGVQRLACYLESLAEPGGTPGVWEVRFPATKTAVASRLGVTKETLSRLLRALMDSGLIAVARREILILDRVRLARLARGGNAAAAKLQPATRSPACAAI